MSSSNHSYSGFVPGAIETPSGEIELNEGRETVTVRVQNLGDRPIQIGSHYHFYEANNALDFERETTKASASIFQQALPHDLSQGSQERSSWFAMPVSSKCTDFRAR